ncbi:MAG: signal peptidase I [Opitutales bacterium]|nr:signal peptidase I [Opitutales bacterium]
MLFFKKSKKKAKDLLSAACKVYNYRCDVMAESDAKLMWEYIEQLEELIGDGKAQSPEFDELEKELEPLMRKTGGKIYPLTTWADYVDMIVVAGIVALGVRSFFLQPFKIPTNSMYPSFYGMTSQVYNATTLAPTLPEKVFRTIFKAASNYSLKADNDGELIIQINNPERANVAGGLFAFEWVGARDMFVIPTKARQYTFLVGNKQKQITIPGEFPIDDVIVEAFPINNAKTLQQYIQAKYENGDIISRDGKYFMKLAKVKKGQTFLNFDILGGDMLFVDRLTYNFRKPKVGEPFVFLTKYCDGLTRMNGGIPDDRYYIKRVAGKEGDTLKIENSTLLVNGKPAKGSVAFDSNAKKLGKYCGYVNDGALNNSLEVKIPQKSFWALGDNSANSLDSRYWGEVPEKAVVGKALIIFYPFTDRWGATK